MDIVVRAAVMFAFLTILLRILGRRELGEMEPADLVLLVIVGDLVQQAIVREDTSLTAAALAAGTIGLLALTLSAVAYRLPWTRPALEGRPVVLIDDGHVLQANLRAQRITHEELAAEARLNQVDDLAEIRLAVLETSGRISFIPR